MRWRPWRPDIDPDEELWVCPTCDSHIHVDSVGDHCPACGVEAEDN